MAPIVVGVRDALNFDDDRAVAAEAAAVVAAPIDANSQDGERQSEADADSLLSPVRSAVSEVVKSSGFSTHCGETDTVATFVVDSADGDGLSRVSRTSTAAAVVGDSYEACHPTRSHGLIGPVQVSAGRRPEPAEAEGVALLQERLQRGLSRAMESGDLRRLLGSVPRPPPPAVPSRPPSAQPPPLEVALEEPPSAAVASKVEGLVSETSELRTRQELLEGRMEAMLAENTRLRELLRSSAARGQWPAPL